MKIFSGALMFRSAGCELANVKRKVLTEKGKRGLSQNCPFPGVACSTDREGFAPGTGDWLPVFSDKKRRPLKKNAPCTCAPGVFI